MDRNTVAKPARHAIKYGAQHDRLKELLGLSDRETSRIEEILREKYAKTLEYAKNMEQAESFQSPIYDRSFNQEKTYTNFNSLIQGSCADILLKCLDIILDSKPRKAPRKHPHKKVPSQPPNKDYPGSP